MNLTIAVLVILSGIASQYSIDTMEQVAIVRHHQGWPIYAMEHIAVSSCEDVGKVKMIRYNGGAWESAQVIDCARDDDGTAQWMEENSVLLEMGYRRAVELDTVGRGIKVEMISVEFRDVEMCKEECIVMRGEYK